MKIADLFVDLKLDTATFSRDLASTLRRASSQVVTVTVDLDTRSAAASLAKFARDQKMKIAVEADTKSATASLAKVAKDQKMSVAVDANTKVANAQLDRVARTREAKVKVDVEGTKGVNFAFRGVSNLTTAIATLGGSAIPILSAVSAGVATLGSSMLAAGGAGGAFALSIQGQVQAFKDHKANVKIIQGQIDKYGRAVESAKNSVASATKGTKTYQDAQVRLATAQKDLRGAQEGMRLENQAFRKDFGETEKGLDRLKDAFQAYTHATAQETSKTAGNALSLAAELLPKLVPLSNAAAAAIGHLVDEFRGFSQTKQFDEILLFFQSYGPAAITSFAHTAGNLMLGFFNVFKAFGPTQTGLLNWIEEMSVKFRQWTASIGGSDGFTKWIDSVRANLPAVRQLVVNLTQVIAKFVQGLGPLAQLQFAGMTVLANVLNKLPPRAFTALATTIASVVVALKAWELVSKGLAVAEGIASAATTVFTAVQKRAQAAALGTRIQMGLLRIQTLAVATLQKAAAAATAIWTVAQKALNAVMRANPIGLLITGLTLVVAGVIYAYKHFDKFRKVVDTAWAGIKKAANVAWTFLKGVFAAIGRWVTGSLIPWFKQLWDYVKKAFKGIGTAVQWVWDHVVKPVFNGYKFYITRIVIPAIQKLWDFVKKAFTGLGNAIKWVWDHVVKPIFSHYQTYINKVVIPVIQKLWDFVKKAFKGIGNLIKAAWDNVVKPILSHYHSYITKVVIPIIQDLWDFVKKAFAGIGSLIKGSWDNVIKPAFNSLKDGLGKVKDAFTDVRDWVKSKWGDIEDAAKKPVRFVVNTVIRDGIIAAINKIPAIPDIKFAGVKFAQGGVMPGYTPGRDVHQFHSPTAGNLALSGGEAIMRPEWTQAIGGEKAVNKINKMAAQHKFARGGLFRPVHGGSLVQGIHDTSTGYPAIDIGVPVGTPVYAGHSGRVTVSKDLRGYEPRISHQNGYRSYGKYMQVAGAGMSTLYAHLSRRSKGVGASVSGGQPLGLSGLTGHTYGPHLHFGARGISPMAFLGGAAGSGLPGAAVSGSSAEVSHLQSDKAAALSGIHPKEWITQLKGMGGFGGILGKTVSHLASAGTGFIKEKFTALINKAKELASKIGHGIGSFIGKINPWDGDDGHLSPASARGAGKKMMPNGWSWSALNKLWNGESGWRWNADNPGSSAYGIPQALPGSKMSSAGGDWHDNAVTQIKWGLGYIGSRYGNSQNAYHDWLNRSPHWYARGGLVSGPGTSTSDSILARVSNGEYIVPAHAVPKNLAALNDISGYASGGKVKTAPASVTRSISAQITAMRNALDTSKFYRHLVPYIKKRLSGSQEKTYLARARKSYLSDLKRNSMDRIRSNTTALRKSAHPEQAYAALTSYIRKHLTGREERDRLRMAKEALISDRKRLATARHAASNKRISRLGGATIRNIATGKQGSTATVIKQLHDLIVKDLHGRVEKAFLRRNSRLTRIQRSQQSVTTALNAAKSNRASIVENRNSIREAFTGFGPNIADYAQSPGGIKGGLTSQLGAVRKLVGNIRTMQKLGYPSTIISQVVGLGLADGLAASTQLIGASPADRKSIISTFGQLQSYATGSGVALSNEIYNASIKAADAHIAQLQRRQKSINSIFEKAAAAMAISLAHYLHIPLPKAKPKATHDAGGWLEKGRTMAVNNTGHREAVLNADQWNQIGRLISAVEGSRGGGGGAPLIAHAVIRENVDLERYERQRAFRDRMTRVGG